MRPETRETVSSSPICQPYFSHSAAWARLMSPFSGASIHCPLTPHQALHGATRTRFVARMRLTLAEVPSVTT
jgi:hypothetical protein